MPPVIPEYRSSLAEASNQLCKKWLQANEEQIKNFDKAEFEELKAMQKQEFLAALLESDILSKEKVRFRNFWKSLQVLTKLDPLQVANDCNFDFRLLISRPCTNWTRLSILKSVSDG